MLIDETVHCHRLAMNERLPGTLDEADEARLIATLLSADERARAHRLRAPGHALRWSRVRARLRQLLAERCGEAAARLRIVAGPQGKPALIPCTEHGSPGDSCARWSFSVSHAGDEALIALSRTGELGVDIERICDSRDTAALVEAVFSESERIAFARCAPGGRAALFTQVWVRKEAVVKAIGSGIGFGLTRVHVGCDAAPLLRIDADSNPAWRLSDLDAPSGYRAALCHATAPAAPSDLST